MKLLLPLLLLAAINLITFCAYGIDKWKAQTGRWRIPEATLLWMAAIGGSLGAWIGMKAFHHKTQKNKFRYGVPALLILHALLISYLYNNYW